jgi:phosphate starvation-inducible PhoH-like protein
MYIPTVVMLLLSLICSLASKQSIPNPQSVNKTFKTITLTHGQKLYWDVLNAKETTLVVGTGPAGCGKTLLACSAAVKGFREGSVKKIILTRPVVSVSDENLGYLPGSVSNKMDPWMRPLYDALNEHYTTKEINTFIHDGHIEIAPLGFMRGRTFKNAWIVADEMQNSTPGQMRMITTRIGEGSKLAITGDLAQSDLSGKNGLAEFIDIWRKIGLISSLTSIHCIELGNTDVKRSKTVTDILTMYQLSERKNE